MRISPGKEKKGALVPNLTTAYAGKCRGRGGGGKKGIPGKLSGLLSTPAQGEKIAS